MVLVELKNYKNMTTFKWVYVNAALREALKTVIGQNVGDFRIQVGMTEVG